MTLRIYNSLTRKKAEFVPLEAGKVKMYVCGVTVYDYCHLGHARAYVVWDMVRRYLSTKYQEVRYVQNITDIDDKILNRAKERGKTMAEIAEEYIRAYNEDMAKLNIREANEYPRATESIPAIIDLIQQLIDGEHAYAIGGDVYYAVQKFPSYGKLSGRKLDDMQAGASGRVDAAEPLKRYPFDFALWKSAKPDEPFWESPWGKGRPGWHIECSAMVRSRLGDSIDIHAGGADLQFPHHENEIAQSEAVTQKPLANYWMHNGFVNIEGEKMSKSLNNFTTIRALLEHYDPMAVRLFILQAHYRQPIDFTEEAINAATKAWHTIYEGIVFNYYYGTRKGWNLAGVQLASEFINRFNEAMDDDFNTSVAISLVFELIKDIDNERNTIMRREIENEVLHESDMQQLANYWQTLAYMLEILGLLKFKSKVLKIEDASIASMIQRRNQARDQKNFAESDKLRDELQAKGIRSIDQRGSKPKYVMNVYPSLLVSNFKLSLDFYDVVMKELKFERCNLIKSCGIQEAEYGFDDLKVLSIIESQNYSDKIIDPVSHVKMKLNFKAKDREAVDSFYKSALENGENTIKEPGYDEDGKYSASILDPDKHELSAVYDPSTNDQNN